MVCELFAEHLLVDLAGPRHRDGVDEQHLVGVSRLPDVGSLLHQLGIHTQPTCGVDDDDVVLLLLRVLAFEAP